MKYMVRPTKTFHNADEQQLREAEPDIAPAKKNADDAENSGGATETDKENVEVGGAQFGS